MDLIYINVRGAEFRLMASHLVKSLRVAGKYTGRIIVFTESMCPVTTAIDQSGLAIVQVMPWKGTWVFDRHDAMAHIQNPEQYSTISLIDADCICLNPLTFLEVTDKIQHQEETWDTMGFLKPGHHQEMYIWAMTPMERIACAHHHPINAGVLTWPGSMHKRLYDAWMHRRDTTVPGWAHDQACLNAALRFDLADLIQPYDEFAVANTTHTAGGRHWWNFQLLHFAGHDRRLQICERIAARNFAKP